MDVARRGRNAVVQIGVRTVLMRAITVVGTIVLARILSPADFGVFAVLVFWMALLLQIADLGLGASLIQQDHEPTAEEIGSAWAAQLLTWLPLVVLVWLSAPLVESVLGLGSDFAWQLRIVSLTLITAGLRAVPGSMLLRHLRFGVLATVEVVQHMVFYVTATVMALRGFGAWSFVAAVLAQALTGTTMTNVAWGRLPPLRFRLAVVRRQLHFGASYQAATFVTFTSLMALPLMGWFAGGTFGIGQLQFATRVGQLTAIFDEIVGRVTFPTFSRLQGDPERLKRVVRDSIALGSIGAVATQGWVVAVAPTLVPLVFGEKWIPAVPALQVLCLSTLVWLPLRFLRSLVYSLGRAPEGLMATLQGSALLLVLAPPLVVLVGLAGAAIAYLTAGALALALFTRVVRDVAAVPLATLAKVFILAVPAGVAAWLTVHLFSGLGGLVASGIVYLAVDGLLLALFARSDLMRGVRLLLTRGDRHSETAGGGPDMPAAAVWTDE